jgi:hypothetical protein
VDVLPAVDPACAWGSALPWPRLRDPAARPARRVGATAILVDGELAVWLEPRARRLATGELPAEIVELALSVGLPRVAARARRRELLIEAIDGAAAAESPFARTLLAGTARADYRGLVVRAQPASFAPAAPPAATPGATLGAGPGVPHGPPVAASPGPVAPTSVREPTTALQASDDATDGLDFEVADDPPEPEDLDTEPDSDGDFDADA